MRTRLCNGLGALALLALALGGCGDDETGGAGGSAGTGGSGAAGGAGAAGGGGGSGGTITGESFEATDHVSGATYTKLLVEIDYVEGTKPSDAVLSRVQAQLDTLVEGGYLGKAGGIRFVFDETVPALGADTVSTFSELKDLQKPLRSVKAEADESVIHVLYVDGDYETDGDGVVLGFAYGGMWVVMLGDNIERSCEQTPLQALPLFADLADKACAVTEASVFLHELGHLFGLVDNGIPMVEPHKDEEHGAHDSNQDCIMYWLNERGQMVDAIAERFQAGEEGVRPFDEACLADLKAVVDAGK